MIENPIEINDVYYLLREERMRGLTIKEAARELGTSTRTIFRMIQDGRLKAEKVDMPYGNEKYIWIIDPMSVARIQVRKEMDAKYTRIGQGGDFPKTRKERDKLYRFLEKTKIMQMIFSSSEILVKKKHGEG